ncbi:MAG: hypothetical protein ACR2JY_08765 [Chloroflexota bacterium]
MRDASAFLGSWPFTGVPTAGIGALIAEYQTVGIDGAAFSPAEAILQPEPMAANRQLFAQVAASASNAFNAIAAPIINPTLPGWEEHFAACRREGGTLVRAVKIVPAYHDYALDHPAVDLLARACIEHGLGLCVQVRMEDERMHHARMPVPRVNPAAVASFAQGCPQLRLLVCGSYMAELAAYRDCPTVCAELSFVESGFLLRDALGHLGPDRLLVGTHTPIHMIVPNAAKPADDQCDAAIVARLGYGNFDRFFAQPSSGTG